jgi:cyclase
MPHNTCHPHRPAFCPSARKPWRFVALAVYFALISVAAGATAADHAPFVNEQYDMVTIGPGIYAFISPESDSGVVGSNCTLIVGRDAALLVDTTQFPSLAKRILGDIRKLTNVPIRYVVNTHWHLDHNWGNQVFRDAYPGVAIIGTDFTRRMDETQGPKFLATQPEEQRKIAAQTRQLLKAGKLPSGAKIPPESIARLTRLADTLDHIAPELAATINVPPTIGFEGALNVNLGDRIVSIMWLGRANTGGDAFIFVPDAQVLLTGDAVVAPTPFAFGSYITEWPVVLQKALALNPKVIIPGHGPVMHDSAYVQLEIEALQTVWQEVKQCVLDGLTLEQTHKKLTLDALAQRFAGSDPYKMRGFREVFLQPAIERAFQEASGNLKPEAET